MGESGVANSSTGTNQPANRAPPMRRTRMVDQAIVTAAKTTRHPCSAACSEMPSDRPSTTRMWKPDDQGRVRLDQVLKCEAAEIHGATGGEQKPRLVTPLRP